MMITPETLFEQRLPITEEMVPGINPYMYYITSSGRVISNYNNHAIYRKNGRYTNGYQKINLTLADGREKTESIHRLVAMAFKPCPGMHNLEVNHIDGNKDNNHISNLEWVTHFDNMQHAFNTELVNNTGENNPNAVLTNEQVHSICRMLEQNMTYDNILISLGLPITIQNRSILASIKSGSRWAFISNGYDFSGHTAHTFTRPSVIKNEIFTEEEVHKICQCFQEHGKNVGTEYVMWYIDRSADYDNYPSPVRQKYARAICKIKARTRYTHISCQYQF